MPDQLIMMIFKPDILSSIIFGLFVSAALLAGLMMIRAEIRSAGGSEDRMADLCFWLLVAAIVGARGGAILYKPGYIFNDPLEFFKIWNGGSFYYGGAVMAIIAGVIFIRHAQMPLWKTADLFAPTLAIGHFFVWLGCFFSGLLPVIQSESVNDTMFSWGGRQRNLHPCLAPFKTPIPCHREFFDFHCYRYIEGIQKF